MSIIRRGLCEQEERVGKRLLDSNQETSGGEGPMTVFSTHHYFLKYEPGCALRTREEAILHLAFPGPKRQINR